MEGPHLIRTALLGVLTGLLILAGYFVYYTGLYKDVRIEVAEAGPFLILTKEHFGPYHKIVPNIEAVETWVKAQGKDCTRSLGQYFDHPDDVEQERLRSRGGCIVSEKIENAPSEFKYDTIPRQRYVIAVFEGAPGVGPIRVYPKVSEFMETKNFKAGKGLVEVYTVHSQKEVTTTYFFPIEADQ